MASSSEAFAKFSTWKSFKTSLKVTVIEKGESKEVLSGRIDAIDEDASLVGISLGIKRWRTFDVDGSIFSVEPTRVVATRDESDWLVFEELSN